MKYEQHKVKNWTIPGLHFGRDYDVLTEKRVLFAGHDKWLRALQRYCRVVKLELENHSIENALIEIGDAVLIAPTIHLREDALAAAYASDRDQVLDFLVTARSLGKPVYGLCEGRSSYAVFSSLFSVCDRVLFVGDFITSSFDATCSENWPALFCSRQFNPYFTFGQGEIIDRYGRNKLIAQGSHLFNKSSKAKELFSILGKNLLIFDYDFSSRTYRISEEVNKNDFIGSVDEESYQALLKMARAQIFVDDGVIDRSTIVQRIVENNACYSVSLVLSDEPEYFAKLGALAFDDIYCLLDALSLISTLPEYCERVVHQGWRAAHASYSFYRMLRYFSIVSNDIKASVISPSIRPENGSQIIRNYCSQVYENKELIVVANGGDLGAWQGFETELCKIQDASIVNLPGDVLAAGALNAGVLRTSGDYCFRLDDDDVYGPYYLHDAILHFIATDSDIMGKKMEYVYFPEERELYRRKFPRHPAFLFGQWPEKFHTIAGNSFALKRSFIAQHGFKIGTSGFADSEFLLHCSDIRPAPKMGFLDSRSLIIKREDAAGHTWQAGKDFFTANASFVGDSYDYLLD